ncbi:MAG: exodeoxyribonuclease VII large subunit [Arenicella sp.]|jgi:exodeoxyribonuclease VII large subunit
MSRNTNVYQVSQLTDEMRRLMEVSYPEIWIEGELSSLSTPASGHLYFSLKDERSQLRCAMFKGRASINRYRPKAGDLVRVRAKISVYSARGDLQCIVQHIEEAGEGLLQRRFEELKESLNQQGLFDQSHKKPLPVFAKHIGIVTSPSGAAVRDIISTLKRRCPGIPITIYPAVVQGDGGAKSIINAIRQAVAHQTCDVLLVSRGGGSLEDLWCFNHEDVAREIYACPIPIVSGVGHEVDVTIADLVADLRAPTPTAAAELVSPNTEQLINQLESIKFRLPRSFERFIQRRAQQVDFTGRQLAHPRQQLKRSSDKLDQVAARLLMSINSSVSKPSIAADNLCKRLSFQNPQKVVADKKSSMQMISQRLQRSTNNKLNLVQQSTQNLAGQLHLVSPLATLDRGFAIARDSKKIILRSVQQVSTSDKISIQLSDGQLDCDVVEIRK